jgi:hypothetical protein
MRFHLLSLHEMRLQLLALREMRLALLALVIGFTVGAAKGIMINFCLIIILIIQPERKWFQSSFRWQIIDCTLYKIK